MGKKEEKKFKQNGHLIIIVIRTATGRRHGHVLAEQVGSRVLVRVLPEEDGRI
jgi:hypothetical protein